MDSGISAFLTDRREHDLDRWHSRLTIQPREALMTHEGSVARIGLIICLALKHYRIAEPDIEAVLAGALTHDASEVITGDLPGGFLKTKHLAFKNLLEEIEREAEDEIYRDLPEPIRAYMKAATCRKGDGTLEGEIIAYADTLDAYNHASQETYLGNVMNEPGDPLQTTSDALKRKRYPWLLKLRSAAGIP